MCDCCNAEGRDHSFKCGPRNKIIQNRLYKVFVGRVASVKLCRLCDIQLFRTGETRFLASNIRFAQSLVASNSTSETSFFE